MVTLDQYLFSDFRFIRILLKLEKTQRLIFQIQKNTLGNPDDVAENRGDNAENANDDTEKLNDNTEDPGPNLENQEERSEIEGENQDNDDDEDDESDDDDVQITIGDIKAGPAAYTGFNLKRGPGLTAQGTGERSKVYCQKCSGFTD